MAKGSLVTFELLTEEERRAVSKAVEEFLGMGVPARVRSLKRFGFSGAKLLLVLPDNGRPFVAKVHGKKEIQKDEKAIKEVVVYFMDALAGYKPVYNDDIGVLIYQHFGANTAKQVDESQELKDVAYDPNMPIKDVTARIQELYKKIAEEAHCRGVSTPTDLRREYRRRELNYLRTENSKNPSEPFNSTQRIRAALDGQSEALEIEYLGEMIDNPIMALKAGFAREFDIKKGPVHGDLHPSNVIFSPGDGRPHLIDFSWAHKDGHILKDFVLMETSLRFMIFPRPVCLDEQCCVDKLLLEQTGYLRIHRGSFSNPVSRRACKRMAEMIKVIREAAQPFLSAPLGFDEYLAAQFLVLYGLLRYESYDFHIGLRALGLIARHLRVRGLLGVGQT